MASDDKNADASSQDLLKKMMNFAPGGVMTGDVPMDTPALKCTLPPGTARATSLFPCSSMIKRLKLPVIVVKAADKEGHLYVLDDPDNPLVLAASQPRAATNKS